MNIHEYLVGLLVKLLLQTSQPPEFLWIIQDLVLDPGIATKSGSIV